MDAIFINSKNDKTSHPHRSLTNLTDKIDLQRDVKNIVLSNLTIHYKWRNIKISNEK